MKRQSRRAAVRVALRRGKPLQPFEYTRLKKAEPRKAYYSCRRGRCEHYEWCDTHRYEQFPCEVVKEEKP